MAQAATARVAAKRATKATPAQATPAQATPAQATPAQATNAPVAAPAVKVIGQGTLADSGLPFLLVTSASELGRAHVCAYAYQGVEVGSRMQCDCMAGQFGRMCKHVLVAREWLALEERVSSHVKRRPARPVAPDATGRNHPYAHPGDSALMRRSNRPFSLLK